MQLRVWKHLRAKIAYSISASFALLFCLLTLTSCSGAVQGASGPSSVAITQWVVAWGAALENAHSSSTNPGGTEQSFRFVILPTAAGSEERIHFSNLLGSAPVTIGAARLSASIGAGPAIDTSRDAALTFNSSSSVTLAVGQEIVSDPVKISYSYGEELAVSVYLKGSFSPLTEHNSEFQNNFETAAGVGNTVTDAGGASFGNTLTEWQLLTAMDVYGTYQGSVAVFGSSSMDGHASNYGNASSYPTYNAPVAGQINDRPSDWLSRQLIAAGYNMGVLNAGAIADPAGEDATTASGTSIAGVDRMKHDVLDQAGIKAVVIYFGGVDLRNDCKPATDVEASLANMVQQAQAVGVRVILATIPPSEYCTTSSANLLPSAANPWQGDLYPGPENPGSTQRRLVNTWIRTAGAVLPGVVAVADYDAVMAYPAHPDFLIPSYVGSDNFHPNGLSYGIQSAAIPLPSILGQ